MFIGFVLVGSWFAMQQVHELGHCLGAWATGGHVEKVVLAPWTISRTDVKPNPHPLVVVWSGPVGGVVLPLIVWGVALAAKWSWSFVLRFFAGFCLIANGLYIGVGSFEGVGDCGEMLRHGSSPWMLWVFGAVTVPLGFTLALWNGLGKEFGLGKSSRRYSLINVRWALAVAVAIAVVGSFFRD
jgi:hypothetical protein